MTGRGFRFGVVNGATGDPAAWKSAAQRAESLGYATFLLPDTTSTPAPLPALAAAAVVTTSLHVGTWVLCDPLRPAAQLAWEAGTLQSLAAGRFELGIGAGRPGAEADCARLGVPFGTPAERVARLADTLQVLSEDLPDTSILIAAGGPRLLSLAARTADAIAFGWPPMTDGAAAAKSVETVRAAAGTRIDDIELACGLVAVGEEEQPWLARSGVTPRELADAGAVTAVAGNPTQMIDALQRRRDALGLSYYTVPSGVAEQFAPVVAALSGR
jgi:probable F420-dependent oxidoreductase